MNGNIHRQKVQVSFFKVILLFFFCNDFFLFLLYYVFIETQKRQSQKDVQQNDQKYNMNLLHNPEMTIQQKNSQPINASPASSQLESSGNSMVP